MDNFDKLRNRLSDMAMSANTSCRTFTALLEEFGFEIRAASGGHKVVTHPVIPLGPVDAANYNCGHNKGAAVGRQYIKHFSRIVDANEDVLRKHLK